MKVHGKESSLLSARNQRTASLVFLFSFVDGKFLWFFSIVLYFTRWVSVVEFHDPTLGIGKVFGQESTVVKWNYQILGLHQVMVRQKLGVILVIKWFKNWSQQKMLFTKEFGQVGLRNPGFNKCHLSKSSVYYQLCIFQKVINMVFEFYIVINVHENLLWIALSTQL